MQYVSSRNKSRGNLVSKQQKRMICPCRNRHVSLSENVVANTITNGDFTGQVSWHVDNNQAVPAISMSHTQRHGISCH